MSQATDSGSDGSRPAAELRWQALGLGIRSSRTKAAYVQPHHLLAAAVATRVSPSDEGNAVAAPEAGRDLEVDLELRFNSAVFLREFSTTCRGPFASPSAFGTSAFTGERPNRPNANRSTCRYNRQPREKQTPLTSHLLVRRPAATCRVSAPSKATLLRLV